MIALIDPRVWLFAIVLTLSAALGGYFYGAHTAKLAAELREKEITATAEKELYVSTQKNAETESALRKTLEVKDLKYKQEKDLAQSKIDALQRDIRTGTVRLSVPVRSCGTSTAGAGTASVDGTLNEARAELLPETASDLIGIAGDADNEVRRTNSCIDRYTEVMKRINEQK